MKFLQKLVSCGGPALGRASPVSSTFAGFGSGGAQLLGLLRERNGFFAFESALLVRPSGTSLGVRSLEDWNEPGLWRREYTGTPLPSAALFFAEDAFGGQFALHPGGAVSAVDPETGESEEIAADLEGWAREVLADPAFRTGFSLARDWQRENKALAPDERLVPSTPFVLGGEYSAENLVAYDALKGMRVRAGLACQIVDVPDGSSIVFRLDRGSG